MFPGGSHRSSAVCPVEFAVSLAQPLLPVLLSAPPRLCVNSVTGRGVLVGAGGWSRCESTVLSSDQSPSVSAYSKKKKNLTHGVDGKAKQSTEAAWGMS